MKGHAVDRSQDRKLAVMMKKVADLIAAGFVSGPANCFISTPFKSIYKMYDLCRYSPGFEIESYGLVKD